MRGTFGAAVLRLMVAGSLASGLVMNAGANRLEANALGGINTITVSPAHGTAAGSFVVTYSISPCVSAAGLTIGFSWNAIPPAGPLLGTATTDSSCRATLRTTPPVNSASHAGPAPGSYQVFGYLALPTGTPTPNTEVSAAYIVDVTATPTPTASATPRATATAQASASAPVASASSAATASQAGSAAPEASPFALVSHGSQPLYWTLAWRATGVGLVLALLLSAAAALMASWMRRRRLSAASATRKDRAA
jgi:hypothetical protein